jgi:serine/threonine protein phosphatase PrpC
MRFTVFQESRKGARRINQDRLAYTYSRDALLLVMADGMGGHAGGEIASQITVRLLVERFHLEAKPMLRDPRRFLQETLHRAHHALGQYAARFSMVETPRTTCVCCVVQGDQAVWANVGDSRLYLLRRGAILARTRDHSRVQVLVEQGRITPEQALTHPDRNKIFSCLGGMVDPVIDLSRRTALRDGDVLLLCTDGLWSVFPDAEFAAAFSGEPILVAGPALMKEGEHRGGPDGDNLSALAVHWGPEADDGPATVTETMPLGEFGTQIERTITLASTRGADRDLTDDEIERAIEEIQATIQRYRK